MIELTDYGFGPGARSRDAVRASVMGDDFFPDREVWRLGPTGLG